MYGNVTKKQCNNNTPCVIKYTYDKICRDPTHVLNKICRNPTYVLTR